MSKYICEFIVKKQAEEKKNVKKVIDGKELEVVETIKKAVPVKVKLLKPKRKLIESADTFRAKQIAHYIREGLLSVHMLAKRYNNDGGALSEQDVKTIEQFENRKRDLTVDYHAVSNDSSLTNEQKEQEKNVLINKMVELQQNIDRVRNPYTEIFDQTAEYKAKSKLLNWWIYFLSYMENEKGEDVPVFEGNDYDQKEQSYDKIDESGDKMMMEVIRKCSYFVSFWDSGGDMENIEYIEEKYLEDFNDYVVVDDVEDAKKLEEEKENKESQVDAKTESATEVKTETISEIKADADEKIIELPKN